MTNSAIIGAQWGDEGKGKIIDALSVEASAAVRFNGADNAGHTLQVGEKKYVTHTLSSGIIRRGIINISGPYEAINPKIALTEIAIAEEHGAKVYLDESCPLILPFHRQLDGAREKLAGKGKIGTTQKGVGPIFESLTSRRFVTLGDLRNKKTFRQALENSFFSEVKFLLENMYGEKVMNKDEVLEYALSFASKLVPYLADTRKMITELIAANKNIIFEGGQGIMLDVIHGAKPDVTASLCSIGGAISTMGVYSIDHPIGVAKAYLTRVGNGAFPTELKDNIGEEIRSKGNEFGATTGRPRRCGWLDLVALNYGCRMGGIEELAITKLDILDQFSEIKVAVDYQVKAKVIDRNTSLSAEILHNAVPVYKTFQGWQKDTSNCRKWKDLPEKAKEYLKFIKTYTGKKIIAIGVGPEREQLIKI